MRNSSLLAPLLLAATACSAVPATVTHQASLALEPDPLIYVSAQHERARVDESLRRAGLRLTTGTDAEYVLLVDTGSQKSSQDCGELRNVRYQVRVVPRSSGKAGFSPLSLTVGDDRPALEIKARGWTGSCDPNVYDEMSDSLAREFNGELPAVAAPPE